MSHNPEQPASLSRRQMLSRIGLGIGALGMASSTMGKMALGKSVRATQNKPNIIFIMSDDQGYYDMSCYGNPNIATPNWDKMATEGVKFTSFYATMVCSPTRASLLTGCNHERVGFSWIIKFWETWALNVQEQTIPRMLKQAGYVTGCVGKWHLGHGGEAVSGCKGGMPKNYGFDYYKGVPLGHYGHIEGKRPHWEQTESMSPDEVTATSIDANTTEGMKYLADLPMHDTENAVDFMTRHKDVPFFLFLAHTAPHVYHWVPDKFKGTSNWGDYGDILQGLDWTTGEIMKALKDLGIEDNTLLIYTSDNGSDREESNAPLVGGKWGISEGSYRVPFLARWPGRIPAGKACDEIVSVMDMLPTFASIAGATAYLPTKKIDGKDVAEVLFDPSISSPRDELPYYKNKRLEAVRKGDFKCRFSRGPDPQDPSDKTPPAGDPLELYNVKTDPSESMDLIGDPQYAGTISELVEVRDKWARQLGDSLSKQSGSERRRAMGCKS
ncbi:MAG: sulfatase-like hydrolase/transferase [Chitinivibrionales bacterium]|nr:sulfatase-like hydrolase/transferase [Chitinivibrionales bacterium]